MTTITDKSSVELVGNSWRLSGITITNADTRYKTAIMLEVCNVVQKTEHTQGPRTTCHYNGYCSLNNKIHILFRLVSGTYVFFIFG